MQKIKLNIINILNFTRIRQKLSNRWKKKGPIIKKNTIIGDWISIILQITLKRNRLNTSFSSIRLSNFMKWKKGKIQVYGICKNHVCDFKTMILANFVKTKKPIVKFFGGKGKEYWTAWMAKTTLKTKRKIKFKGLIIPNFKTYYQIR